VRSARARAAMARSLLNAEQLASPIPGRRLESIVMENENMKSLTFALLVITSACSTATPPPRATASGIGSPHADFKRYQTFTFGPSNPPTAGFETTARSLEVQRRLATLVQDSLQKRGYRMSPDKGDLVIKISTGSGTLAGNKIQRGNPAAETFGGFIGVDAYDGSSGAGVWHGSAFAEIDPEHIDEGLLSRGVDDMLAFFPARDR
jgi:Domain of unknown function (DUF4136)